MNESLEWFGGFLGLMKLGAVSATVLILAAMVLLSLPKSRLRAVVLKLAGYGIALFSAIYVVSPIDGIPDVIPVVGWIDDAGAIVGGIGGLLVARKAKHELEEGFDD